jgi:hypothetical protein
MAKKKASSPQLPPAPSYQPNPQYQQATADLLKYGNLLAKGDFSGELGWLKDTITVSPELIANFRSVLEGTLAPAFRESNKDLVNQLANVGALESSTTSNKLGQNYADFMNTISNQTGAFQIGQTANALENRIRLETLGLDTLKTGGSFAGASEANLNQFNLQNYENQVAQALYKQQNQAGGWKGALTGGLGGGLIGAGLGGALALAGAPFTGGASLALLPAMTAGFGTGALLGGGLGAVMPQTTGNQILQGGIFTGTQMPNMVATNNMFRKNLSLYNQPATI